MRWGDVRFPSAVRLAAKIAGVKIDGNDLSEDIDERVSARTELAQLEQQTSAWHGKLQEPKTVNAIRTFAVSTRLLNHLHGILQTWRPNAQQLVFATRNGTPWDANLLVTVWRFRWKYASSVLGTAIRVWPMDVYTHMASADDERIAEQLGEILDAVGQNAAEITKGKGPASQQALVN
jgi:hypothetical protein